MLEEDNVVLIKGKLDNSRGSDLKFIANEIKSPDGLPGKQARTVHIRFDAGFNEEESLYSLRDFVFNKAGNCTLFLHFKTDQYEEVVIQAHSDTNVAPTDELISQIEQIVGERAVSLVGSKDNEIGRAHV